MRLMTKETPLQIISKVSFFCCCNWDEPLGWSQRPCDPWAAQGIGVSPGATALYGHHGQRGPGAEHVKNCGSAHCTSDQICPALAEVYPHFKTHKRVKVCAPLALPSA